jgi:hypothetical protein
MVFCLQCEMSDFRVLTLIDSDCRWAPGPPTVALKVKTVLLPHYALGLLMMGCKRARNMQGRNKEIKRKIVHRVGVLHEYKKIQKVM